MFTFITPLIVNDGPSVIALTVTCAPIPHMCYKCCLLTRAGSRPFAFFCICGGNWRAFIYFYYFLFTFIKAYFFTLLMYLFRFIAITRASHQQAPYVIALGSRSNSTPPPLPL